MQEIRGLRDLYGGPTQDILMLALWIKLNPKVGVVRGNTVPREVLYTPKLTKHCYVKPSILVIMAIQFTAMTTASHLCLNVMVINGDECQAVGMPIHQGFHGNQLPCTITTPVMHSVH